MFDSGNEDKFSNASQDLKESIVDEVSGAFLSNTTATKGVNLNTYMITKDKAILEGIRDDIPSEIAALLGEQYRESEEA